MKKYFLQAFLLLSSIAAFAQDDEEHSAAYEFGRKNAIPILLGVIALIVIVIVVIRNRKKKTP